jgi:2-dehydro-3-deoxygluconokinase
MPPTQPKFAAIGECMIELFHQDANHLAMSFAGDTYNVTLYLARYAPLVPLQVNYLTALGDDPYSSMMLAVWQQEGIHVEHVQRIAGMLPGLYFIRTDKDGERHFYFYRAQSAAKRLFYAAHIENILAELVHYQYLYFSGITLAILDDTSRARLFTLLGDARRNGATIVFDTNYRPALWDGPETARAVMRQALSLVDMALVTLDDEQKLFGEPTPEACIARLQSWGVKEVALKLGAAGCVVATAHGLQTVPGMWVEKVVDTTAAGDSFNAAYLAARIKGFAPEKAAEFGNRLAATVIGYAGAIIPKEKIPKLFSV